MIPRPLMHLLHGSQPPIQHRARLSEDSRNSLRIGPGPAMLVQVRLGNFAECLQVSGSDRLLELIAHWEMPFV